MMSSSSAWTSEQDPASGSSSPKEESHHETEGTLSLHSLVYVSIFLVKPVYIWLQNSSHSKY